MNDISVTISINNNLSTIITPYTDLYETIMTLKNQGINIISDDPDNCIISRIIYQSIFPFYNENNCRGDTLNTYNSTFGKDNNYRLMNIINKENITIKYKNNLMEKIENFKRVYHSIGNFTILERWHKQGEVLCINSARGIGSLRDSWPLTLICIQDYLSGYSRLKSNPLINSFNNNEATINFFKQYLNVKNGFELFCRDHYFNPELYENKIEASYLHVNKNGNYDVNLDLFDGLCFLKPLPDRIIEIEQYMEKATIKIIERGKILLNEYIKINNQ